MKRAMSLMVFAVCVFQSSLVMADNTDVTSYLVLEPLGSYQVGDDAEVCFSFCFSGSDVSRCGITTSHTIIYDRRAVGGTGELYNSSGCYRECDTIEIEGSGPYGIFGCIGGGFNASGCTTGCLDDRYDGDSFDVNIGSGSDCDPEDDLRIYDDDCSSSLNVGERESCYIEIKNYSYDCSYSFTEVKVDSSGVSVTWHDDDDSSNGTIGPRDVVEFGDFDFTPNSSGNLSITMEIEIDNSWYDVDDDIDIDVDDGGCNNECSNGDRECTDSNHYRYCNSVNNCYQWYGPFECQSHQTCIGDTCESTCTNQCTSYENQCTDDTHYKSCTEVNGCWVWSSIRSCSMGTTCNDGVCRTTCPCPSGVCCSNCNYRGTSQVCSTTIEKRCEGTACSDDVEERTRTQYCRGDSSSCIGSTTYSAWQDTVSCSSRQKCNSSTFTCYSSSSCCSNECSIVGQTRCLNDNTRQICVSQNGCLVWGNNFSCICRENSCNECVPDWVCSSWTCFGRDRVRNCTDINSCGTSDGRPQEYQICPRQCTDGVCVNCVPDWQCADWACENNDRVRNCHDANFCGINDGRPGEYQDCPEICSDGTCVACVSNWQCSSWTCENNDKIRNCQDVNNCGSNDERPVEYQDCPEECSDGLCTDCAPDWQCTVWSSCERNTSVRECVDMAGCEESQFESMSCDPEMNDCEYTNLTWLEPLAVHDGDDAYFRVTWQGNCGGDILSIIMEETTWRNRVYGMDYVADIQIDSFGLQPTGGSQDYSIVAFFVDHPFGLPKFQILLSRIGSDENGDFTRNDVVESDNELVVDESSADLNVEDIINQVRIENECNSHSTVTPECFEYWNEMGMNTWEEEQFHTVFEILDWIWKGSCAMCGGGVVIGGAWVAVCALVTEGACLIPVGAISIACEICIGRTLTTAGARTIAKAVIEVRVASRIAKIERLGTLSHTSFIGEQAGVLNYFDDAVRMTEVYGITPRGLEGLTFVKSVPNFIGEIEGGYDLIRVHRQVVKLDLSAMQGIGQGIDAVTVYENQVALTKLMNYEKITGEIDYFWELFSGGKVLFSESVNKIRPVMIPSIVGAYGVWKPGLKEIELTAKAGDMMTASGNTIPRYEAVLYHVQPHELGHAATTSLLSKFRDPAGVAYSYRQYSAKFVDDRTGTYWVNEFFNDVQIVNAIQSDVIRYQRYIDGAYGMFFDAGEISEIVEGFITLYKTEAVYQSHYVYLLAEHVDYSTAELFKIKMIEERGQVEWDQFMRVHEQMKLDAVVFHHDLVVVEGFQATNRADRILKWYRFVENGNGNPHEPRWMSHEERESYGLEDESKSVTCGVTGLFSFFSILGSLFYLSRRRRKF